MNNNINKGIKDPLSQISKYTVKLNQEIEQLLLLYDNQNYEEISSSFHRLMDYSNKINLKLAELSFAL